METKNFFEYIRNSNTLGESALNEIEQILEEYPYFQSARLLHLKIWKNLLKNNALTKIEMHASNVFITDRKHMFRFLMQQSSIAEPVAGGKKIAMPASTVKPEQANVKSFEAIIREVQQTIIEHKNEKEQLSNRATNDTEKKLVESTSLTDDKNIEQSEAIATEIQVIEINETEAFQQAAVVNEEVIEQTKVLPTEPEVKPIETFDQIVEIQVEAEVSEPEIQSANLEPQPENSINDEFNFDFPENIQAEQETHEFERVIEFDIEEAVSSVSELQANEPIEIPVISEEEKLASERERRKEERRLAKELKEQEKAAPDEATIQRQKVIEESIQNLRKLSSKKNDATDFSNVWDSEPPITAKETANTATASIDKVQPNEIVENITEAKPAATVEQPNEIVENITETKPTEEEKKEKKSPSARYSTNKTENIVLGDKVIPEKEIEARSHIIEEARRTIDELNKKSREQQFSKENQATPEDIKEKLQQKIAERIISLTENLSAKFVAEEAIENKETVSAEQVEAIAAEVINVTEPENAIMENSAIEFIAEIEFKPETAMLETKLEPNTSDQTDEIELTETPVAEIADLPNNTEAQNEPIIEVSNPVQEQIETKAELATPFEIEKTPGAAVESPADRVMRMIAEKKRLKELKAQEQAASESNTEIKPEPTKRIEVIKPLEPANEISISAEKALKLLNDNQKQIKPVEEQSGTFLDELAARLMGWADTMKDKQYAENEQDSLNENEENNVPEDLGLLLDFEPEKELPIEQNTVDELIEIEPVLQIDEPETILTDEILPVNEEIVSEEIIQPDAKDITEKIETVIPKTDHFDMLINKFIKEDPKTIRADVSMFSDVDISEESASENFEIVSESLAKVYTGQKLFDKAIIIYQKLILKYPEKSSYFATCISDLEKRLNN